MQVENDAIVPGERWVSCHDPNVIHRAGIARDRLSVFIVWIDPLIAADKGCRLPRVDTESLD